MRDPPPQECGNQGTGGIDCLLGWIVNSSMLTFLQL
jgi:hypothetical protein